MPKTGNTNAKTHGIDSLEARGTVTLAPAEIASLADLRALAKTEAGRTDIKVEVIARLGVIAQKFFADCEKRVGQGADLWNSGVISRGATYLETLRRYIESMPPDRKEDVIDAVTIIEQYRTDGINEGDDDAPNS